MAEGEEQGWLGKAWDYLAERVLPEIVDTAIEKVIPQGAAELAQALNTGQAYVPYGPAQAPLEIEAPQAEPAAASDQGYDQMLAELAARGGGDHGQAPSQDVSH